MMSPGLPTWAPNFNRGVPPETIPRAWATLVLPRSRAWMKKVPELKVIGTVRLLEKLPYLSVWTKLITWPGCASTCVMARSTVERGSKPLPFTPMLVPWRTIPGLSRTSAPTALLIGTCGVLTTFGVGGGGLLGMVVAWLELFPSVFTPPRPADWLRTPNTTAMATIPASTIIASFQRFMRPRPCGRGLAAPLMLDRALRCLVAPASLSVG